MESVNQGPRRALDDAHGSVPLNIAVTADGAGSSSWPPDVSAEQEQVHDLLNVGDTVFVLGEAHRPTDDDRLGLTVDGCGRLDVFS